MTNKFEQPAAYVVHDAGPRRFYRDLGPKVTWNRTKLGKKLLTIMASHGLDKRDADLRHWDRITDVSTDLHRVIITDVELVEHRTDLDAAFASIAAGVAQWRMLWLSGWNRQAEIPFWAVTASEMLLELAARKGQKLSDAYDVDVDYGEGTHIAFYGTGMHLNWYDKESAYNEWLDGATLKLPTALLRGVGADLIGRSVAESCSAEGELAKALARYRIVDAEAIKANVDASVPQEPSTILQLAVPIRTLEPIPEDVLTHAGLAIPADVDRDYPLWMMTSPEQLRSYRPRLER